MPGMTDRDHFAAAALTGLIHSQDLQAGPLRRELACTMAYRWADAMLRERAKTNHDAAPAARASVESVAPQPTTRGDSDRTDKAAPRPSEGTGDTPATHATRGECSEPREGTEPVAWAVMDGHEFMEFCTDNEEAKCAAGFYGDCPIVPLYRQPPRQDVSRKNLTLTDADAETLRELRDEAAQYADEIGLCASEVRARQRIIDGLLERMGGGA